MNVKTKIIKLILWIIALIFLTSLQSILYYYSSYEIAKKGSYLGGPTIAEIISTLFSYLVGLIIALLILIILIYLITIIVNLTRKKSNKLYLAIVKNCSILLLMILMSMILSQAIATALFPTHDMLVRGNKFTEIRGNISLEDISYFKNNYSGLMTISDCQNSNQGFIDCGGSIPFGNDGYLNLINRCKPGEIVIEKYMGDDESTYYLLRKNNNAWIKIDEYNCIAGPHLH